jgi:nicotinamide-nucleotide amidase
MPLTQPHRLFLQPGCRLLRILFAKTDRMDYTGEKEAGTMFCQPTAEKLVELLQKKDWRITFAESCTGGLAAAELVAVSSASTVFDGSFVTYADSAKLRFLQVSEDSIRRWGVVSEAVALEMAQGACAQLHCQVGVGISGIAGPAGATQDKPLGMVCFGFVVGERRFAVTKQFGDIGRNRVRRESVEFVYETLLQTLRQV